MTSCFDEFVIINNHHSFVMNHWNVLKFVRAIYIWDSDQNRLRLLIRFFFNFQNQFFPAFFDWLIANTKKHDVWLFFFQKISKSIQFSSFVSLWFLQIFEISKRRFVRFFVSILKIIVSIEFTLFTRNENQFVVEIFTLKQKNENKLVTLFLFVIRHLCEICRNLYIRDERIMLIDEIVVEFAI